MLVNFTSFAPPTTFLSQQEPSKITSLNIERDLLGEPLLLVLVVVFIGVTLYQKAGNLRDRVTLKKQRELLERMWQMNSAKKFK
jgi:hypothetical protein